MQELIDVLVGSLHMFDAKIAQLMAGGRVDRDQATWGEYRCLVGKKEVASMVLAELMTQTKKGR